MLVIFMKMIKDLSFVISVYFDYILPVEIFNTQSGIQKLPRLCTHTDNSRLEFVCTPTGQRSNNRSK